MGIRHYNSDIVTVADTDTFIYAVTDGRRAALIGLVIDNGSGAAASTVKLWDVESGGSSSGNPIFQFTVGAGNAVILGPEDLPKTKEKGLVFYDNICVQATVANTFVGAFVEEE